MPPLFALGTAIAASLPATAATTAAVVGTGGTVASVGGLAIGGEVAAGGLLAGSSLNFGQALQLGGTVVGGLGALSAGAAAKNQANFQADLLNRQAIRARQTAAREADLFARQQSALRGNVLAGRGASGVALQGTALLTDSALRSSTLLGEETIRRGGIAEASDLEAQARLTRFKGRAARTKSFANAGETLLSGFGKAFA